MAVKTQYVATTSHGSDRWIVVVGSEGESKDAVREAAARRICGDQWDQAKDIYTDTELKQLQVLPFSKVRRSLFDEYYERLEREA